MKRQLILHTGAHKTGTTSLQTYLAEHEQELQENYKIYIPHLEREPQSAKIITNNIFPFKEKQNALLAEFRAHSNCNFLISNEGISSLKHCSSTFIDDFRTLFQNHEIRVIYYIRRIDDFFRSMYLQFIKDDGRLNFFKNTSYEKFCEMQFTPKEKLEESFLYSQAIAYFEDLVGSENVTIRIYDNNSLINGNIIDDFLHVLNIKANSTATKTNYNKTINASLNAHICDNIFGDKFESSFKHHMIRTAEDVSTIAHQDVSQVNTHYLSYALEEIKKISQTIPAYAKLYEKKPCDLSFDALNSFNPEAVFHSSLLYQTINKLENISKAIATIENEVHIIKTFQSTMLRHQNIIISSLKVRHKPCYFWGYGTVYEQNKHFFNEACPKAILVDITPSSGLKESVDGIPIRMAQDVLGKGEEIIPIVLFARPEYIEFIIGKISSQYPLYMDKVIVCSELY